MVWDNFQVTPSIPMYILSFYVGEFYGMKTQNIGVYTRMSYIR